MRGKKQSTDAFGPDAMYQEASAAHGAAYRVAMIAVWVPIFPFRVYESTQMARKSQRELDELNANYPYPTLPYTHFARYSPTN